MSAVFSGNIARRWWRQLPPEEKAAYSLKVKRNRYIFAGMLGSTVFGAVLYYYSHLHENPMTKRKQFLVFTKAQMSELSKYLLDGLKEEHKLDIVSSKSNVPIYHRVNQVCQQLLNGNQDQSQVREREWTVTVINNENIINAFVLPCGNIFVFSGLLSFCYNDDQLAIILGHEMAHAVLKHGAETASQAHFFDLLFIIPLAVVWALLPSEFTSAIVHLISATLSELLMELPHSRLMEEEADKVGLLLAAKACFDIREAPVVWGNMGFLSGQSESEEASPMLEWVSTHPSDEKRQKQLEDMLPPESLALREKCQCPRLSSIDPRDYMMPVLKEAKQSKESRQP